MSGKGSMIFSTNRVFPIPLFLWEQRKGSEPAITI